jgi:hypothetical protein
LLCYSFPGPLLCPWNFHPIHECFCQGRRRSPGIITAILDSILTSFDNGVLLDNFLAGPIHRPACCFILGWIALLFRLLNFFFLYFCDCLRSWLVGQHEASHGSAFFSGVSIVDPGSCETGSTLGELDLLANQDSFFLCLKFGRPYQVRPSSLDPPSFLFSRFLRDLLPGNPPVV